MKSESMIHINKTVSRNFLVDIVSSMQNFFGLNISGYERMVDKAMKQIVDELKEKNVSLSWHRFEISQLGNGSLSVTLYGEVKE